MSQPLPSEPNFRSLSREEDCQLLGSLDRTVTTIPSVQSPSSPGLLNRRPSLCPSFHDVDVEDLGVGLAHVGSYSSGIILDLGALSYPSIDPRPKTIQKQAPSVEATQYGTFEEEATPIDESVYQEEGYEGTKYIGIAPIRFWLVFSVILLSYFIACFDSTLMASSHPVITSHFGAAQAASWLSTVFLITSTAFQPLSGRLSDTLGRKPVLLLSLAIFGTTTLGCALAGRIEVFIIARALCGVGAGGTMSMCLIIVSDLVRLEYRGVFQSHINVAFGLGSASGAAFGGWLCDTIGWRWAFGIQVPFIFLCFLMAAFLTPSNLGPMLMISEEDGGPWSALRSFDSMGSLCFTITITSLILALNLGGNIVPWSLSWRRG